MLADIGFEQDASAVEHPCRGAACRDQFAKALPLDLGELDYVLFVHGGSP
jgi:hypothetical protein